MEGIVIHADASTKFVRARSWDEIALGEFEVPVSVVQISSITAVAANPFIKNALSPLIEVVGVRVVAFLKVHTP